MGDFLICFANLESIYIEPDLSLVQDKFSVFCKIVSKQNVNRIVELNMSLVYCVVQSSFHYW